MIRVTIVDDEQHCIDQLVALLDHYRDRVSISSIHHELDGALQGIGKYRPDVVFLDVQLGERTAFELLQQLPHVDFTLIFTTAYEQYAISAFKYSALDYLLKPIGKTDFDQALNKAIVKTERDQSAEKVRILLNNLSQDVKRKKISIPTVDGLLFINVSDIIRCEADVNYTDIFMVTGQKHTVSKTLKYFDDLLSGSNFFRVHQSHLINLDHIKKYQRGKTGTVVMADNTSVEVSLRRKEQLLSRLNEM